MSIKDGALMVYYAVIDEGQAPHYHREKLRQLNKEWPTLYLAVMRVVAEVKKERGETSS